jgi:hypothetical protein
LIPPDVDGPWSVELRGFGAIWAVRTTLGDLTLANERGQSAVVRIVDWKSDNILVVEGHGPWPFTRSD